MSVTREHTRVAVWEFEELVLRQSAASASEMFKFHILYSYKIRQLTTSSYKFTFQTFHFQFSDTWRTWSCMTQISRKCESDRTSEHFMSEDSSNLERGESIENLRRINFVWWLSSNWLFRRGWELDVIVIGWTKSEWRGCSIKRCFSILSSASFCFLHCPCSSMASHI